LIDCVAIQLCISVGGPQEEEAKHQFWANVSLLTGWEIVRRLQLKENIDEIVAERDPDAILESGLRLINNVHIQSPAFLVNVALALL